MTLSMKKQSEKPKVVLGLDFGTGSLGEALRVGDKIVHAESFLFDENAGKDMGKEKKRPWRTKMAHRAREFWLCKTCEEAGLKPLKKMVEKSYRDGRFRTEWADTRLTKEFPSKEESVTYNSALLRIKLLEGKDHLEDWQVFKALHSAIQKRGYDADVVWAKNRKEKSDSKDEDGITKTRISEFEEKLGKLIKNEKKRLPCYFEALSMKLWSPVKEEIISERIDHNAETAKLETEDKKKKLVYKGYVAPRGLVEKELKLLLEAAKKRFPKIDVDYVLYGPLREAYGSYKKTIEGHVSGSEMDWQGVLGQKIPRFDNRSIGKCSLMPLRNAKKAKEKDNLWKEVQFLLALKKISVASEVTAEVRLLNEKEFSEIYRVLKDKFKKGEFKWKANNKQLGSIIKPYKLVLLSKDIKIESARASGRLSFCNDALFWLRAFLLSGQSPSEFLNREHVKVFLKNTEPKKGLSVYDFQWLVRQKDRSWSSFSIIDLSSIDLKNSGEVSREIKFKSLLRSVNNPVVRHRLEHFWRRLTYLQNTLGKHNFTEPDKVIFELVREDNGKKARDAIASAQKEKFEKNKIVKTKLKELGLDINENNLIKYNLFEEQNQIDLYTGETIDLKALQDKYDIDHIVPASRGGPDAFYNYVLTSRDFNSRVKREAIPYEYFSIDIEELQKFKSRIDACKKLSSKKINLLLSKDAEEKVTKYTNLAGTAYIARLAQRTVEIFYGWNSPLEGEKRRIQVVPGVFTARARRKFDLNKLLGDEKAPKNEKDRKDKRHHALDAMLLCMLSEHAFSQDKKQNSFNLPSNAARQSIVDSLERVVPKYLARAKPAIDENNYGVRSKDNKFFLVKRNEIRRGFARDNKGLQLDKALDLDDQVYGLPKSDVEKLTKLKEVVKDEASWLSEIDKILGRTKNLTLKYNEFDDLRHETLTTSKLISVKPKFSPENRPASPTLLMSKTTNLVKFIATNPKNKKLEVRQVYAFESVNAVKTKLLDEGYELFCEKPLMLPVRINLKKDILNKEKTIDAGVYLLTGLRTNRQATLERINGQKVGLIHLEKLLEAELTFDD